MIATLKTALPLWVFQPYGNAGAVACYPAGGRLTAEAFGELSRVAPISSVCGYFYVVTHLRYEWSNRNRLPSGKWATFFYALGAEMATGTKVYYGRNEWATEAEAAKAQNEWEQRCGQVSLPAHLANVRLERIESGGALVELLFWSWLAVLWFIGGRIMVRILFGV